ncbi:acetylglutamate kinase [Alicyclobacillus pomorum]|uniref:acetylglutamate kinase n=1 Tax=Alicyclobacillus pomorum TaxID=204470 RepID=UPI000420F858|nr:acetylglutamate kinase [Alicyclobacillus pomorum]
MNRPVVLKIGGSLQGKHLDVAVAAMKAARETWTPVVLVHGGGPAISAALKERNLDLPFIDGHRLTTPEAMDVVEAVLSSQINPSIVTYLEHSGYSAVGLSGADGILWAEAKPGLQRTGQVHHVSTEPMETLLAAGNTPVLSPVGVDRDGRRYNINADLAASAVAAALNAQKMIFFTDVPGIYSDWESKSRLVDTTACELRSLAESGLFHSGMLPKVSAVLEALDGGVQSAYVIQGDHPANAVLAVQHTPGTPWQDAFGTHITSTPGGKTA